MASPRNLDEVSNARRARACAPGESGPSQHQQAGLKIREAAGEGEEAAAVEMMRQALEQPGRN